MRGAVHNVGAKWSDTESPSTHAPPGGETWEKGAVGSWGSGQWAVGRGQGAVGSEAP